MARRTMRVAAAAVAMAALLVACGDDDDSGDAAPTTEAAAESADTTAGGADATTGDDSTDTTTPSFDGDENSEFCQKLRELDEANILESDGTDPAQLEDEFTKAREAIDDLEGQAPDEIRDDLATFSEVFGKLQELYERFDWDITRLAQEAANDPSIAEDFESLAGGEFEEASARLTAYGEQVCGLEPEG